MSKSETVYLCNQNCPKCDGACKVEQDYPCSHTFNKDYAINPDGCYKTVLGTSRNGSESCYFHVQYKVGG